MTQVLNNVRSTLYSDYKGPAKFLSDYILRFIYIMIINL